jgi:polyphosphate kinase 2
MSKKDKKKQHAEQYAPHAKLAELTREAGAGSNGASATTHAAAEKLSRKEYERALKPLQVELVKLQEWVKHAGLRVVVVFEGRDTAGKGGCIKAITERVSPRVFRVVALPAPTEREKSQLYMQRYLVQMPAAGEIILFDRSWYNRAGVEHVMRYCTDDEYQTFLTICPAIERALVRSGIMLVKYWLDVDEQEQTRRFEERMTDRRKFWKLSPMDVESYGRYYDYSRARDAMLIATDTDESPWHVVDANDQRRARLNCIAHLLSIIPYQDVARESVELPKRQKPAGYTESNWRRRVVPAVY